MTDKEFEEMVRARFETCGDIDTAAFYSISVALIDLRRSLARDTERIMSKLNTIAGNLKNG